MKSNFENKVQIKKQNIQIISKVKFENEKQNMNGMKKITRFDILVI